MKITLLDINPDMVKAWQEICGDLPNVEIRQCSFHAYKGHAIVSPANSFGFMDGGIDQKYSEHFGWDLQKRLQDRIKLSFHGELPVGQATLVATNHKDVPWLIAAPTMRSPMVLGSQTLNPYLATRAALIALHDYLYDVKADENGVTGVGDICFPGMGTGCGKVPYELCAHQMRRAIEQIDNLYFPDSWIAATDTTDDLLQIRQQ